MCQFSVRYFGMYRIMRKMIQINAHADVSSKASHGEY